MGNHPGEPAAPQELRQDIDAAFSFSPAKHRVNLHSCYAEPAGGRERSTYTYEDFAKWVAWAKEQGYGVDFNASFFTHPMMRDGFSLASKEKEVRDYWVRAGVNARAISEEIGKELGTPCYNNIWIPDGYKDLPANRFTYRGYLQESLDRIFEQKRDHGCVVDVLEGKLFSIGYECFTVGSHEFYLGYAAKNGVGVCLDTGHYHPTESVVDKLSSIYPFVPDLLLHVSRGVRWDSDHVLIQGDDLQNIMHEMHRGGLFGKVAIGLDYFDATINRVAAWSIGLRACSKAILTALLTPGPSAGAGGAAGRPHRPSGPHRRIPESALQRSMGYALPEKRHSGGHHLGGRGAALRAGRVPEAVISAFSFLKSRTGFCSCPAFFPVFFNRPRQGAIAFFRHDRYNSRKRPLFPKGHWPA